MMFKAERRSYNDDVYCLQVAGVDFIAAGGWLCASMFCVWQAPNAVHCTYNGFYRSHSGIWCDPQHLNFVFAIEKRFVVAGLGSSDNRQTSA